MLEILLLFRLSKSIGAMAEERGLSKVLYIVLLVVFWFIGEIGGGLMGAVIGTVAFDMDEPMIPAVIGAIAGAACGAALAFALVTLHSPRPRRTFEDEEEHFQKVFQAKRNDPRRQTEGIANPDDENQYRVRPAP